MYGLKALQADGLVAQRQEVKPALVEGQAHGGARPQEDGQHLLQHLHGGPLTHVPNCPSSKKRRCFCTKSFCFLSPSFQIHDKAIK